MRTCARETASSALEGIALTPAVQSSNPRCFNFIIFVLFVIFMYCYIFVYICIEFGKYKFKLIEKIETFRRLHFFLLYMYDFLLSKNATFCTRQKKISMKILSCQLYANMHQRCADLAPTLCVPMAGQRLRQHVPTVSLS